MIAAPDRGSLVPRLGPGMKFRFDEVRATWMVLGPERAFLADEHAVEVLKLVDGRRSFAAIVVDLAARYAAPPEEIEADVWALLEELSGRGAIRFQRA